MKKFLSLFLALVMIVGLLVPAVSADPGETEAKTLASWIDGAAVTSNGKADVLTDVELTVGAVKNTSTLSNHTIKVSTGYGNLSATPWYGTEYYAENTQYAYVAFQLSTKGYESLKLSALLGGNARVPHAFALLYSLDNETWKKVDKTIDCDNKDTKDAAISTVVDLPAAAADQELVYFRLAQAEGAQPKNGKGSNAGALYIYELSLTGTVKQSGGTPAEDEIVDFAFLATSDLHGQIYATDYTAGYASSGTYKRGLTRVASYIKEMQAQYGENLFIADIGDTIQGTPLTWYYAFNGKKLEADDPAIKAFRTIGYDMWVVGNHEFNYGIDILNRQLDYATSAATETEKQLTVSMANYLDADAKAADSSSWKTWKGYAPYVIKEFDGVKVAVIGFGNPNIAKWDGPANRKGIYFAGIYETYKHYEAEMLEKADMIVVMSHSGFGSEAVSGDSSEDSVKYLVENTNSISFVFSGHEHGPNVTVLKNKDGKDVNVLQPYTKARKISQVKVSYNKTKGEATIDAQNINMEGYKLDTELAELLKPYEETVWKDYMLQKIGTANDDFPAAGLGTAPSAFMDLINQVQIWGAYDRTGKNTPDDKTDDTPAQLSISAPLTSGDNANLIPKGDIMLGDMFGLYRFENWFYQLNMSGKEIRTWLEFSATKIRVDGEGNPYVTNGDLTYYDVIYGDDFSYQIDYTKPEGSRVVSVTYKNKEVADDQNFTVVMNNYRFTGGGGYVAYLNEHGCNFVSNDKDENRVIYSTQWDMIQGEDEGQARTLLASYIREAGEKGISPDIKSTWSLINGKALEGKTVILHSNDVHGAIDGYAYMAGVKKAYENAGANVIVADAGDYSQGTVYVSLSKGADAITMMNAAGYDVVTLGNHEFDYGYEQIKANMAAFNGKVLCANVLKDGNSIYDGHTIIEKGGVKIGFFGLETPEASTKANPALIKGLLFPAEKEMYQLAEKQVEALKAEGADIIVCLAHLGVDDESKPNRSYDLYANVKGIDFIIDAHSHTVMTAGANGEPIQSTGTAFANIGVVVIDNATKKIESNFLVKVREKAGDGEPATPKDGAVQEIADQIKADIDAAYGEVFAKTETDLNGNKAPGNRTEETNLGDLITDAMLWKILQNAEDLDVPEENILAITNGGGIRASIAKGNITKKDVNTVLPFGNTLAVVYITGAELLEALEASTYCTPGAVGGFPQVAGIKFTIDTTKEYDANADTYPGSTYHGPKSIKRVTIQEVNGKPFDPKATYAVITNNFLAAGGDTYYAFASATSQFDTGLPLDEVLMEYITEGLNGVVTEKQYGKPQGRITVLTKEVGPKPSPATGDNSGIEIFMISGVVSVLALGACLTLKKKKEN